RHTRFKCDWSSDVCSSDLDVAGSISSAVANTTRYLKEKNKKLLIEVETRNLKEVQEALSTNAIDIIMLDNMSIEQMKEAVKLVNGKCKTEASGGITDQNLRSVAESGVDYI